MPRLIYMVGVAGSGKSTIAMRIASQMKEEVVLLSSDTIRGEIYGDENCQRDPGRVFDIMRQRTVAALSQGISVIYDATNLSCKRRMNFLKSIAHIDCRKECVVVITTPEDIEERMKSRDRKVSMEVVHKQLCQFQCPNYYEGWDVIDIEWTSDDEDCFKSFRTLWRECDMPHDNSHHRLDIEGHMIKASIYAAADKRGDPVINSWVARIHDIGKPRVKSFVDKNGKTTTEAHYYGHQNYGAYYALIDVGYNTHCYHSKEQALDDACLIQWHMEHFFRKGEALTKFHEMIGPALTARLQILEDADIKAH